ncbi:MAG: DUF21 domain-containing protein [Candidatus Woesearchaeota archaeon]|nr:DUF21 domain-containing protein [Nanoarchaeota archaeon]USN44295.1 MAG: DUF21 domain-containing protein [Candidatus Woesearchaeota archaeon]
MEIIWFFVFCSLILICLLYLSAWFAGFETALINLDAIDLIYLKEKKSKNLKYIEYLKKDIQKSILAILVLNNLINVLLSSLPVLVASTFFSELAIPFTIAVITILIIIFGDILPKSKAVSKRREIVEKRAFILFFLCKLLRPLISLLYLFVSLGPKEKKEKRQISPLVLKSLFTQSYSQGNIEGFELSLLTNSIQFSSKTVSEVMVPVQKLFFLEKDYTVADARKIIAKSGYTRVPFLEGNIIRGVVYAKDLLKAKSDKHISQILRQVLTVDTKMQLEEIFYRMRKQRVHLVLVLDEKLRVTGFITLEDIVEELVGDIFDEYYKEKKESQKKRKETETKTAQ